MNLEPCPGCARHVRREARECPFCGFAKLASAPVGRAVARVSRAAVFAGALNGCWTTSSGPATSPPPPPPHDDGNFAKPPEDTKPAAATATVDGLITEQHTGGPLANVTVELRRGHAGQGTAANAKRVRTDGNGHYQFTDLEAGNYTLVVFAGIQTRMGYPSRQLTLDATTSASVDVAVKTYDPNPIKAPYGAPPARRRVV